VGDQHDRHLLLLLDAPEELEDLGLDGDVEGRRRLVGDQQRGVAGERHRDHHALPHTARELVRVILDPPFGTGDADQLEQLHRPLLGFPVVHLLVLADRLGDLLAAGEDGVERGHRLLEDHRDVVAAERPHLILGELEEVAALEQDPAGDVAAVARQQPHDAERGDALATARLTDDAEGAALIDVEVDAVDRLDRAVLGLEVGLEALDPEDLGLNTQFRPPR